MLRRKIRRDPASQRIAYQSRLRDAERLHEALEKFDEGLNLVVDEGLVRAPEADLVEGIDVILLGNRAEVCRPHAGVSPQTVQENHGRSLPRLVVVDLL